MQFKRHILMTSAAAALAMGTFGGHAFAQAAAGTTAAASSDSQTVVVTGIRKSLQSALKQKRNADGVEEVITAQDIGKFPDKNVADSLARATGVNDTTGSPTAGGFGENEKVSIRGTDPELNLTLLDGHSMATGDWFVLDQAAGGRSFNYTMLPSEMVGTIDVRKAATAELVEGGIGGAVDVHMRNPLDLPNNSFSGEVQALYSTLPKKTTPYATATYNWKNDGHTFGILVGAYYEQRDFRRDGQEILGYGPQANFAGTGKTVYLPSLVGSAFFEQQRTREGIDFNTQWKASDAFELDVSGIYTYLKANNENHNFMFWGSKLGADTPNAGYTTAVGPDGNTYLTSASWSAANTSSGTMVQDDIPRQSHSDSYDLNADATWHITPQLTAKGQLGYTGGEGVTDDSAAWESYWTNTNVGFTLGKPVQVTTGLGGDTTAAYLNNKFSWSWGGKQTTPDRETYAKVDFDYELGNDLFKSVIFGARVTDHTRTLTDDAYAWAGNGANSGTSNIGLGTVYTGDVTPANYGNGLGGTIPGYTFANTAAIYNYLDSHNGGRIFGFYGNASFGVHEKTQAYYAMTKLGGDKWQANVGVRAVHTDEISTQYTAVAAGTAGAITSVFGQWVPYVTKHSYWDFLPSVTFTYKPTDDLVLRADASKVMTRPGYSQLAGYFYLVDTNYTGGSGGNPNLDPYRATQLNLSAEWYYTPEALLSVAAFDIDISNYISSETFSGFYTDQQNPSGHTFQLTGPVNGGKAKTQGLEVSWQTPLAYGFGVIANATYAQSSTANGQPLVGTSKLTYNLTGYYEAGPISTRLAYNYRSHFYLGIANNSPDYQDDYGTLDGSFSYQLTPHWSLNIDAQNLTHQKLYYYDQVKWLPRAIYDNGQQFYAGFRFKY